MTVHSAPHQTWAQRLGLIVLVLAVGCAWWVRVDHFEAFRFDDTFMTLRYARNLVEHGVLSFNTEDRVDGYTSPAWTLWMATLLALGAPGEISMLRSSLVCGCLALFAAIALARRLGSSWPWAATAAIGPLSTTGFLVWSASGMETALVALTACLALTWMPPLDSIARQPRCDRWLVAPLLVLCATARPENSLLAAMLWGASVVPMTASNLPTKHKLKMLAPFLITACVLVTWFAWRWSYYGHPLPNTYYAKAGSADLVARGRKDLLEFLRHSGLWLAPLAALGLMVDRRAGETRARQLRGWAFLIWFVAVCFQYARAGGDHMGYQRFYQPLVPASFAFIAAAISRGFDRATQSLARRQAWVPALGGTLAIGVACWAGLASQPEISSAWAKDSQQIRSSSHTVEQWRAAGHALAKHFPPTTSMSIRAAGVIPYITNFRAYDTLGLNNQDIAHNSPATGKVPGHQKEATAAQVVAWKPDIIVNHPVLERRDKRGKPPRFFDPPEYRAAGYQYECIQATRERWLCFWARPRS